MHIKCFQLDLSDDQSQALVHFVVPVNLRIRSNSIPSCQRELKSCFPYQDFIIPHLLVHSAIGPCVEQLGQALCITWKTRISGSTCRDKTKYVN